jgi:hypothetical protein
MFYSNAAREWVSLVRYENGWFITGNSPPERAFEVANRSACRRVPTAIWAELMTPCVVHRYDHMYMPMFDNREKLELKFIEDCGK